MKNKIMIGILLSAIFAVSLVSGYLGEELVTCGDFTCDTDWVGFKSFNWTYDDTFNRARYLANPDGSTDNLSQAISIQSNRLYNVTLNASLGSSRDSLTTLIIYLGGTRKVVENTTVTTDDTVYSFNITSFNTDGLFLEGFAENGITTPINLWSISVKEVITPPKGCIVQLKKAREIILEQKGIIQQLKRDKQAIKNGIKGVIVQLRKLLKI